MTSPEHTLVGIHLAFAAGVHRWVGWRGVALAAVASNFPDWDGIPMLFDMQRFEAGHRVWGHSLPSILLTSFLLGMIQARWDCLGRIANRFPIPALTSQATVVSRQPPWIKSGTGVLVFATIGIGAQVVHVLCDMVVSGGNALADWAVQPWWPFSDAAYVYPLIPWGDVGPTIILMAGLIIIAKRNAHLSQTSWLSIVSLCAYLIVRGWMRGTL